MCVTTRLCNAETSFTRTEVNIEKGREQQQNKKREKKSSGGEQEKQEKEKKNGCIWDKTPFPAHRIQSLIPIRVEKAQLFKKKKKEN